MTKDDWVDLTEGFLTVFVASFAAAVMNGATYQAPNVWAIAVGALGGILAAVRKLQAHRAPAS